MIEKTSKNPENQKKEILRVVFDKQVRAQGYPIYKVMCKDVCVEWTDKYSEGLSAYKDSSLPKELWKVGSRGDSTLIYRDLH